MNVENLRLNDLIPYENNAKTHHKKQINNVMEKEVIKW